MQKILFYINNTLLHLAFSTHGRPKQLSSMKRLVNYSCSR